MKSINLHPILLGLILSWIPISLILIWSIIPTITISIVFFILLLIWMVLSIYLIWVSNKKVFQLEDWAESYINRMTNVYTTLHEIDSSGHFESDDEVGIIFQQIKNIIQSFEDIVPNDTTNK